MGPRWIVRAIIPEISGPGPFLGFWSGMVPGISVEDYTLSAEGMGYGMNLGIFPSFIYPDKWIRSNLKGVNKHENH
jgi:hypothetical protein